MKGGWVYIMAHRRRGVLYVGITANLPKRVWEHRQGVFEGFTDRYGVTTLVWYEWHERIEEAIQREKNIKHWPRKWKIELIENMNPEWRDLYEELNW
jgi:putative endonuclease